jgi:OOP family OmpA-OmpF porin
MKSFITVLSIVLPLITTGQNLVPDSSFEHFSVCPINEPHSMLRQLDSWYSPTTGTPDYYNKCAGKSQFGGVPKNGFGIQSPKTGSGYIGLYLGNRPEYAQIKLKSPLQKGVKYCITIHANLPDFFNETTNKISVALTSNPIISDSSFVFLYPSKRNITDLFGKDSFITDKINWIKLCSVYQAIGGEEYLTIGVFRHNNQRIYWPIRAFDKANPYNGVQGLYYFIDDVSVISVNSKSCVCAKTEKFDTLVPIIGESIVLKNVLFETDKNKLLPNSSEELDILIRYLRANLTIKIIITGHTDDRGNENYNLELSNQRAKAVADYLLEKGIDKLRILYIGKGSAIPIDSNKTEKGRRNNRRVEIFLSSE